MKTIKINEAYEAVDMSAMNMGPVLTIPDFKTSPCEPTFEYGEVYADVILPPYWGWGKILWLVCDRSPKPLGIVDIMADIYGVGHHKDEIMMSVAFTLDIYTGCICTFTPFNLHGKTYEPDIWRKMCKSAWKYVKSLRNYFRTVNNLNRDQVDKRGYHSTYNSDEELSLAAYSVLTPNKPSVSDATPRDYFDPNTTIASIASQSRNSSASTQNPETELCYVQAHQRRAFWRTTASGKRVLVSSCSVKPHTRKKRTA